MLSDEAVKKAGNLFNQKKYKESADIVRQSQESLEKLVTMLEKNESTAAAGTLLRRYTGETFDSPAGWRKWLNDNKLKLFFTDVGGYKWMTPQAQ